MPQKLNDAFPQSVETEEEDELAVQDFVADGGGDPIGVQTVWSRRFR